MVMFTPMNGRAFQKRSAAIFENYVKSKRVCDQVAAGKTRLGLVALEGMRMFLDLEANRKDFNLERHLSKFPDSISKTILKQLAVGARRILEN